MERKGSFLIGVEEPFCIVHVQGERGSVERPREDAFQECGRLPLFISANGKKRMRMRLSP